MPNFPAESFYRWTIRQSIPDNTSVPFTLKVSKCPTLTAWLLTISPNTANEEIIEYDGIDAVSLTITVVKRWINPSTQALTTSWTDYNNTSFVHPHSQNSAIRGDVNHLHIIQGYGDLQDQIDDKLDIAWGLRTGLTANRITITDWSGNEGYLTPVANRVVSFDGSWNPTSSIPTVDINSLSAETSLADGDAFPVYDTSAASNKKITKANLKADMSEWALVNSGTLTAWATYDTSTLTTYDQYKVIIVGTSTWSSADINMRVNSNSGASSYSTLSLSSSGSLSSSDASEYNIMSHNLGSWFKFVWEYYFDRTSWSFYGSWLDWFSHSIAIRWYRGLSITSLQFICANTWWTVKVYGRNY